MVTPTTPAPSACTCRPCPHCRKQEAAWQRLAEQEREREVEEAGGVNNYLADRQETLGDWGGVPPW